MKKLTTLLVCVIGVGFVGVTVAIGESSANKEEAEISTYSTKSHTQTVTEQEQKRKKAMENMKRESDERKKQIREKLPKTIEDIRKWIKENKFPAYQGEVFWNLAKVDDDPRVYELYCEVVENASDIRAKLSAIAGIKHINNRAATPTLKKALSDKSIFVRCAAADTLFDWEEKDMMFPVYKRVLEDENLEEKLDKELPEAVKLFGFGGDKSSPQWELTSYQAKKNLLTPIFENIITYDKALTKNVITKVVNEKRLISIIEKYIELERIEIDKRKTISPDWAKMEENKIKPVKDLIKLLYKIANEE